MQDCFETGEAKFNKLFLNAVDDTISDLLGENAKKALYIYLKTVFFLKKNDFIKDLEAFHKGLTKIFGESAIDIENLIAKVLYQKIDQKFEKGDFASLIIKAKIRFTTKRRLQDVA